MSPLSIPSNPDQLIQSQKSLFLELARGAGSSVVIMGAGILGQILAEGLRHFPVTIECFCDNAPAKQGTTFMDCPVLAVEEAVRRYNGRAAFVVGIFTGSVAQAQLRKLGCERIITAATLCRHFGPPLLPACAIDYPTAIYEQRAEVERCANIWADDKSHDRYAQVIHWFLASGQETLVDHDPAAEMYFPDDLWKTIPDEHFVDCGAFNGDTIMVFLEKKDFQFRAVTAYDPDPRNFAALQQTIASLPPEQGRKISAVNAALGTVPGVLHFSGTGTVDSSVCADGGLVVKCVTLDEEHRSDPPTFLKMDIEGYELEALAGARGVISAHAPILAITTYHKVEHLWRIPLLIRSFRPDYQFYLRHYAEDSWETICYAVPTGRALHS